MARTSIVDSDDLLRPMLRLALPALVEQFSHMLVGFSDTMLTGWYLTKEHLAAVNLMSYLLWLFETMFFVVAIGAGALVARSVGAKDIAAARRAMHQSFLLGALVAVAATLVGTLCGRQLIELSGLSGPAAALALRYASIVFPALVTVMIQSIGNACLRAAGDTVAGLWIMGLVNAVNIAFSWALVLGVGPFPNLGWEGIALGTALGQACGGVATITLLAFGRAGLWLRAGELRPDRATIQRLLHVGLPGGADVASIVLCQFWFLRIVNELGSLAAAAHGVAIKIEALAYLPGVAFQVAASTMAGQFLGARDPTRARRSVVLAAGAALAFLSAAGAVFYVGSNRLPWLFLNSGEADVAQQAAPLLRTVALVMPPFAILMVLAGALRGSGDTRWPLAITLVGFLGVRIPLAYLMAQHWEWGVQGAWYAMQADIWVRFALVSLRFRQGGWTRVRV